jgi:hypothetical protein
MAFCTPLEEIGSIAKAVSPILMLARVTQPLSK